MPDRRSDWVERGEDQGPPPGVIDRRGERQPDDPGCVEAAERHLGRWAAIVVAITTLAGATIGGLAYVFVTKAEATEAHVALRADVDKNTQGVARLEGRVDRIDINTAKSLRLQLVRSVREIEESIAETPAGSTARRALEKTLDETRADLSDIEAQLGVKR